MLIYPPSENAQLESQLIPNLVKEHLPAFPPLPSTSPPPISTSTLFPPSDLRNLPQPPDRTPRGRSSRCRNGPRAARDGLPAALAVPDAHAVSLDRRLAAKGAGVAGVLGDFHLLHLFAEGGAVSVGFFRLLC